MTIEISDIMEFVDTALQTEGVERVVIDGIVDEGPLALFVVAVDGIVTEFYADPDKTREPIDYFYANQQLLEETYNVDIEAVPEDDLEVNIVFHKRRVLSPETLYRDGTITRDAFAYVQKRYNDGANIAVTGADLKSINAFINYLIESVSHPPKTVVLDSYSGFVFGVDNDALIIISGYDSNIFSMVCRMNANRIFTADKLSEEDVVLLHESMDTEIKFVAAMPDDGNGYVTTEEVNHFDLEIEIELVDADEPIRVKSIREISSKGKPTFTNISQYVNGQHIVTI
jgi:hypothetical protein